MKKFLIAILLFLMPKVNYGQAPTLGTAANYVLFTTDGAMTNSGVPHLTHLTGNVGSNLPGAITGFGNVDGQMHDFDASTAQCVTDVGTLYSQLSTATPGFFPSTTLGNGDTLVAGVYFVSAAATLSNNLILNAQGNSNAVFIFQIGGALSVAALSKVKLVNGALACNVFWDVEGLVSVSTGATLRGTILAHNHAINLSALDTLEGRALSINGAITLNAILAYTPLGCGSTTLTGPTAPALASAGIFAVFSSIGAVTATPITFVNGDVGSNSTTTTGFNPLDVFGTIHTPPDAATASCASDLTIIYNYLNGLPADILLLDPSNFGYGLVLTPHVYLLGAATTLTDTIYLNAEGDANAVFVIQVNGQFLTGTLSNIKLINGTKAKNVYWLINGAVHIFDNSLFNGQIIAAGAITLNTGDTLNGRALTINGAVEINGSYVNNTPPPCIGSPITGSTQACFGSTITLADVDTGGRWSSSNVTIVTVDSLTGVATALSLGVDTITYTSYIACVSTISVTVNPAASPITGPSSVCVGSTVTLNDASSGGKWSSSDTLQATVDSTNGHLNGIAAGTPTIAYVLPTGCMATRIETVNTMPNAGTITGGSNVCIGSTLVLIDTTTGGIWSSSNSSATVSSGTVNPVSAGIDTIRFIVSSTCGIDTATKIITITPLPNASVITGSNSVCIGSTLVLVDTVVGGSWSSSNLKATVSSGTVNPVATGIDTIYYVVTNFCGTDTAKKIISINTVPTAGTITGGNVVCVGSTLVLNDITSGGTWSSSNSHATVMSGTVNPVSAGVDTIMYIVSTSCGSDTATKTITINPLPNAGSITGGNTVCVGSSLTLTDVVSGGVWNSSNTHSTVSGGMVTGVSIGTDTILYSVSNTCGNDTVSKIIDVITLPNAGTITGNPYVCLSFTATLTDGVPGGVWSATNTVISVVGGVLTGNTLGTDTISYLVTNACGANVATIIVSVNPLPFAGVINGLSSVCIGSNITMTDLVVAGTWSMNNANAVIVGGVVTGVIAGVDTVRYVDTNLCGTDIAEKSITINPLPNAGIITGVSSVCAGSSITLADTILGGVWMSSNATATDTGGVVTGVTAGVDTILYFLANVCGADTVTKIITINPLPNAGIITGSSTVCLGSTTTLASTASGGIWSGSNPADTVTNGIVQGNLLGKDTIYYTVTNVCGTNVASKIVTVITIPNAGIISGESSVCLNTAITLSDATTGGVWSVTNANASVSDSFVKGLIVGMDTVIYSVTNVCGTGNIYYPITINPLPDAGTIAGLSSVCVGSKITLTDTVTGGAWSCSNINASIAGGVVSGIIAGVDTVRYVDTNMCGTDIVQKAITINPLPYAGTITGSSNVCIGLEILLTDNTAFGVWQSSNAVATVSGGAVIGVSTGIDTIRYMVTNVCGTDTATKVIAVNPNPSLPIITTHAPSSLCSGTLYQNFGTSTPPPAGTRYNWTAINATVWAESNNGQYALISFTTPGTAQVMLSSTIVSTGCLNKNSETIDVQATVAQTPTVLYFQYHFVCLPANEDYYQWGYDDKTTLDSTILHGEVNQDYLNTNPDFANKYYWVMTGAAGCNQKTYLTIPTLIQNVNVSTVSMSIFPNPADARINVEVFAEYDGDENLEITNISGQKLMMVQTINHKAGIDVTNLPAGFYMINCYHDGIRIANSRFIKN